MKKILVLGVSFDDAFGVGVTLRNLFAGIDRDRVCVADFTVTERDFPWATALFNLETDARCGMRDAGHEMRDAGYGMREVGSLKPKRSLPVPLLAVRKYLAYYYNNYVPFRPGPGFDEFIRAERPDYLYVVPYSRRMIGLALATSSKYGIPLVTHIMDDFRNRSPKDPLFLLNEVLMRKSIARIVRKSFRCCSICESMSKEYERIFRCEFHPFHNPIRAEQFRFDERAPVPEKGEPLRILYAGTIAENNIDALLLFAKGVEKFNHPDQPVHFDIHSPTLSSNVFYRRLKRFTNGCRKVFLKEKLNHDDLLKVMPSYHLLLLPLTFSRRYHHVIKFSFPTKVAEYLASGIPTLYLIPPDITLHTFIREHGFGYLIDRLSATEVAQFLGNLRETLVQQPVDDPARTYAFEHFNVTAVSDRFSALFTV